MKLLAYEHQSASSTPSDPAAPAAARALADWLVARVAGVRVEHIGSTAVPGCPDRACWISC